MYVTKRDGTKQEVSFDKVLVRLKQLCHDPTGKLSPLDHVNYQELALSTIKGMYAGVTTTELDHLAATLAQPMSLDHPDYEKLASRILISGYHKDTAHRLHLKFGFEKSKSSTDGPFEQSDENQLYLRIKFGKAATKQADKSNPVSFDQVERDTFRYTIRALYENLDDDGNQSPLLHPDVVAAMQINYDKLNAMIDYSRDYLYDYIGFTTLAESYLFKCHMGTRKGETGNTEIIREPIERPQHMMMRIAVALEVCQQYEDMYTSYNGVYDLETIKTQLHNWQHGSRYPEAVEAFPKRKPEFITDPDHLEEYTNIFQSNRRTWDVMLTRANDRATPLSDDQLSRIKRTYDLISQKYYTHATPTLFAAGTLYPQLSSCYLTTVPSDSIEGIGQYISNCMVTHKYAGGIGSHVHKIRCKDSYIRTTNGISNGLPPMIQVMGKISSYVDQGGGKRPGTHAIYCEPWHGDIFEFLNLKLPHGNEEQRARNLTYGLWMCDEFSRCVAREQDLIAAGVVAPELWYLMCPDRCPGLSLVYDGELHTEYLSDEKLDHLPTMRFTRLYRRYIREGRYIRRVSALKLWEHICKVLRETGGPYICNKDAGNRKSNQQHIGTIQCSNLCTEIYEVSSSTETAVCNLASVALNMFIVDTEPKEKPHWVFDPAKTNICDWRAPIETDLKTLLSTERGSHPIKPKWIDFSALMSCVEVMIANLNKVIQIEFYPTVESRRSNERHMPLGLGVQGLADLYSRLRLTYDSEEANQLNFYIFEAIYYAALKASCRIAKESTPHSSYKGSPVSRGILQHDMWEREIVDGKPRGGPPYPYALDWAALRNDIYKFGVRNSLLVALMPTASTSIIMGNSRSFEPHNGLIYKLKKKTEYMVINTDLQRDLFELGLWNKSITTQILANRTSSIAEISEIPRLVRNIYKTAWDMSAKAIIDQCLIRSWFVDQGQSMNLFLKDTATRTITSAQFYAWRRGIKTGSYYTRGLAGSDAQKVQLAKADVAKSEPDEKRHKGALLRPTAEQADKIEPASPTVSTTDVSEDVVEVCRMAPGCKRCES